MKIFLPETGPRLFTTCSSFFVNILLYSWPQYPFQIGEPVNFSARKANWGCRLDRVEFRTFLDLEWGALLVRRSFLNPHSRHLDWRRWGLPKLGTRKSCTAFKQERMSHRSLISVSPCWKLQPPWDSLFPKGLSYLQAFTPAVYSACCLYLLTVTCPLLYCLHLSPLQCLCLANLHTSFKFQLICPTFLEKLN